MPTKRCKNCHCHLKFSEPSRCSPCAETRRQTEKQKRAIIRLEREKIQNIVMVAPPSLSPTNTPTPSSPTPSAALPSTPSATPTLFLVNSLENTTTTTATNVTSVNDKLLQTRIQKNVTGRVRNAIKTQLHWFETTEQLLGCTLVEYRKYIENLFKSGMSWDNWGQWSIDHIYPLSKFQLCDPLQRLKAFHYQNTRPVWTVENLQKSCRVISTDSASIVQ